MTMPLNVAKEEGTRNGYSDGDKDGDALAYEPGSLPVAAIVICRRRLPSARCAPFELIAFCSI